MVYNIAVISKRNLYRDGFSSDCANHVVTGSLPSGQTVKGLAKAVVADGMFGDRLGGIGVNCQATPYGSSGIGYNTSEDIPYVHVRHLAAPFRGMTDTIGPNAIYH